jgi:hypothetical protein
VLWLALGLLPAAVFATSPPQFAAPVHYSLGTNYDQICAGDFNGDGKSDLALISFSANKLLILTNDGGGGFAACKTYPCPATARCLATGDFNNDQILDVAVVNYPGDSITVWLGAGDGAFTVPSTTAFTVNQSSPGIALGDFNNNGKLDVAVATYGLQILTGRGDGYFDVFTNYSSGITYAAATGILNNDTNLDVVTGNYSASSMTVCLGAGDGTFPVRSNYSGLSSEYHYAVAISDLNNDGRPDLVTLNYYDRSVSIRTNNGDGSFGPEARFSTGLSFTQGLAVGDFNGDGNIDLATAYFGGSTAARLAILTGRGDATFGAALTNFPGSGSTTFANQCICVADLNGDGRLDIATTEYATNCVSILLNQSLPELQILLTGDQFTIVAPNWAGWTLECATSLLSVIPWVTVTNAPTVSGGRKTVSSSLSAASAYFRLRR